MAITTTGSGNWSSTTPNAPWPSGTVPGAADAVTIASGHTVTLDTTGCVCLSLTVASGGTLTCTTAATWDLTVGNATGDTINIEVASGGYLTLDMSSTATYAGNIYLNKGNSSTARGIICSGTALLRGIERTRWTRLNGAITAGATSATVDAATNWKVGDVIIFGSTQPYNATPRIDTVTLTSVSGTSIGWSGGITYDHADNGYVGNFTSNLTIQPYNTAYKAFALFQNNPVIIENIATRYLNGAGVPNIGIGLNANTGTSILSRNAIYEHISYGIFLRQVTGTVTRQDNISYTTTNYVSPFSGQSSGSEIGNWERCIVFKAGQGCNCVYPGEKYVDSVFMSHIGNGFLRVNNWGNMYLGCSFLNSNVINNSALTIAINAEYYDCDFGVEFGAYNNVVHAINQHARIYAENCTVQTSGSETTGQANLSSIGYIEYVNKNNDVTQQEVHLYDGSIKRDNTTFNRSTSSIAIYPTVISTDCQRTLSISCANGSSIRVVGYVKKSHATNVSATVALTGLGSSVTPFTKANDTAWEQYDLSATNSSGNDGNFTLTYTANSSSGTTNVVYFDGVPDSPFVTKCRHYGFRLADEALPTRSTNVYTVASEATAIAYTGVTITNATKLIEFAAGTADTAQKFYDFAQAWCCEDLSREIPLSRAGTLYSMTTGWTVVDPYYAGSLTWSGGTVQYTATGTKSDNLDGCIVEFDAVGTFTFDGTISGTLDLQNLGASAISVELPTGSSYTTSNNTGGTITVSTPQIYQSVTLTGVTAGSRVQIYDVTHSTELFNDTTGYAWTDGTPAAGDRAIRVRISYVSGASSKEFIEANIGTCGTTSPSNAVTYLVNQSDDAVYNANAIDGSVVTGITFTDSATDLVNIDVASNSVTWPTIYAAFVYWIFTEAGIADDIAYIQAKDTANYTFTSMQIKNTSSPSEPLVVSGGYGIDNTTGASLDLVDTTGGTLIFAPDHVVAKVVTVGGENIITGDIATVLAAIPSSSTNASAVLSAAETTPIHSNVQAGQSGIADAVWSKTLP